MSAASRMTHAESSGVIVEISREWLGGTYTCERCEKGIRANTIGVRVGSRIMHERCAGLEIIARIGAHAGIDQPVLIAEPSRVLTDDQQALDPDVADDLHRVLKAGAHLKIGSSSLAATVKNTAPRIAERLGMSVR